MQTNLQSDLSVQSTAEVQTDAKRVPSGLIELSPSLLEKVAGGMSPNGTWGDGSPNGTW